MDIYFALTLLICLSALFAYANRRILKLPFVIGLFILSTILSLVVFSAKFWLNLPYNEIKAIIHNAQIDKIVLNILLGFLLFAGSLHTKWANIKLQIKPIVTFAFGGVLASTIIIATLFYFLLKAFNVEVEFIYCLLFGALISPTDPIAVLGILTKANVPKRTESIIVGESLFNDGVGVVVFIALLDTLKTGSFSFSHFGVLFFQEAIGGIGLGLLLGYVLHIFLRSIDHYETEILLTLAFVMGGYAFCNYLHVSGALAMVVIGLMVGNFRQDVAMSDMTQQYVNKFWELIDVILNAILFIIIAFVLIDVEYKATFVIIGLIAVLIVIFTRAIIIFIPNFIFPKFLKLSIKESKMITWGGLRGGLSLALALSLPDSEIKNIILIATYFCVVFSIVVQGLTIEKLAK